MYVYQQEDNTVAICSKQSSIPEGATWKEVESVPDSVFRSAWRIVGDAVVTNIDSAKLITHDLRRVQRQLAFAPLDAIIALQIPGNDATQAEADRLVIRNADDAMQIDINDCTTEQELIDIHITEGL